MKLLDIVFALPKCFLGCIQFEKLTAIFYSNSCKMKQVPFKDIE